MTDFSKTFVCNHNPKLLAYEGVIEHTSVHAFCVYDAAEKLIAVSHILCPEEGSKYFYAYCKSVIVKLRRDMWTETLKLILSSKL